MKTLEQLQEKKRKILAQRALTAVSGLSAEREMREKEKLKKEIFDLKYGTSIKKARSVGKKFSRAAVKVGGTIVKLSKEVRSKENYKPIKRKISIRPLKQKKLTRVRRRKIRRIKPIIIKKRVKIIKTRRIIKPRSRPATKESSSGPFDFGF